MSTASSPPVAAQRTFLGHPLGLYVLFFTEMWERFSFYGMRALLVLYLLDHFKWTQREASNVYKWYTSLVYLTPLLGGYLADRWLGNKRAVIIGAILMAIGQFLMTFDQLSIFYAALVFLIFGNGFFKPNMSTQVGRLYPQNDPRRDGAYTIFYMGINLGAFLSPLVCGWLAANTIGGRHTGFMAAGIGMVLGLIFYLVGQPWIKELKPEGHTRVLGGEDRLPPEFVHALSELQRKAETAADLTQPISVQLGEAPPNFDVRIAGLREDELRYDPDTRSLIAATRLSDQNIQAILKSARGEIRPVERVGGPISEAKAEQTPSTVPHLNRMAPMVCAAIGLLLLAGALVLGAMRVALANLSTPPDFLYTMSLSKHIANNTLVSVGIVAFCALIGAWILGQSQRALRDRVLTIYVLGVFVVFFWAAFEQAGNALNVWADKTTNRYLAGPAQPPPLFPEKPHTVQAAEQESEQAANGGLSRWITMWKLKPSQPEKSGEKGGLWAWIKRLWSPVPAEYFQSINALAIFVLAPIFAWLWTALDRRGLNPSVPGKMALGLVLISAGFGLMIFAAQSEDQPTETAFKGELPPQIKLNADNQLCEEENKELKPYHAGRLVYDKEKKLLLMRGVLADTERDRIVRDTAPQSFNKAIEELKNKIPSKEERFTVSVRLDPVPPGFDLRYAGLDDKKVRYDEASHTLTVKDLHLGEKDLKALRVAAGEPTFRAAVDQLYLNSAQHRVSPWWLFWFYIFATLAELCLSPVGLSMVSKLAPANFATMLMGLWLLTSFFGNFAAGAFGERWGEWTPTEYFLYIMALLAGAALVLFLLVRKITAMMHGVR